MDKTVEITYMPLEEALDRWIGELESQKVLRLMDSEELESSSALGRITAFPVNAVIPSPHYYAAAIDGIAVKSLKTVSAAPEAPVKLKLNRDAYFVDIGSPMPQDFDAVMPIEQIKFLSADDIEVKSMIAAWKNVRPAGEEMAAKEMILPKGHRIRALDIGAMLLGGVMKVKVRTKPKIGILAVGSRLKSPGTPLELGELIESNAHILSNLLHNLGADPVILDIAPEHKDILAQLIKDLAGKFDLLLVVGGPSKGTAIMAEIISQTGELLVAGVGIKPGQSVVAGTIKQRPVLALPHYAVSAFIAFKLFAAPVICRMLGIACSKRLELDAVLSGELHSPFGVEEFRRVEIGKVAEQYIAVPISRGAATLMSLVKADGLVRIPAETELVPAGTKAKVELLTADQPLDFKLIIMGTHDIMLEIMHNEFERWFPPYSLCAANVGSIAGLKALQQGYAHISGLHLFDTATGTYNLPFVRKELQDTPAVLVNCFFRKMGFIVAKGNPKNIVSWQDLTRPDIKFMNRRMGSGTRTLLDYHLAQQGINPGAIRGYDDEAYTHMSLALAIAGHTADVGIGINMAANAFNLDFVPLLLEQFDFAIPRKYLNHFLVKQLLALMRSTEFRNKAAQLEGYDLSRMGESYEQ